MNEKRHVMITGGSGLIGQALSRRLLERGDKVTILSRNPSQIPHLVPGAQGVQWDGHTLAGWSDQIEQADAIVNLAGHRISGQHLGEILFKRWTPKEKGLIVTSRVAAGHVVTQAVQHAKRKPAVLIQASAVGYYGPRGDEAVDESTPPGDDFVSEVCREWEASTEKIEAWGVRRVILRIGLVFSAHEGFLPVMILPFRLFAGGPTGSGNQYLPWIHLQDTIQAILFLVDNPTSRGVYNLSAPQPVTNIQFAQQVSRILRRPAFLRVPDWALEIMLGEKATLALHGQRALPKRLLKEGFSFQFPDLESALRDLLR